LKITNVEAIILRQPEMDVSKADGSQDALLIRIETDAGITGFGEVDSLPSVVKAIVDAPPSHAIASGLRHLLIGENPLEIDRLWHKLYRGSIYYGRQGPAIHAISGIDIALWDSTLMPDTPEETARIVTEFVGRGFTAVKLGWGPFGRDADLDIALVRAARQAAGDEVELMFDIGLGWPNADYAIRQVRRFEEYRPYWVEEPLWPDDVAGYRKLADAVETRIACGEEDATRWGFAQLMERGNVDVIQPDVTRAGGISECVRIAQLAELNGVTMVPHAWSTGIIKAASLHLLGAMPNATFLEYCVQETALNQLLTVERFPIVDGMVALPDRPGLGIEIDEDVVRRYAV
jgi:L-rhamnonate dehydratase